MSVNDAVGNYFWEVDMNPSKDLLHSDKIICLELCNFFPHPDVTESEGDFQLSIVIIFHHTLS